jgi:TIR domain-containing protein
MIARSLLAQTNAEDVRIFYSYARRDESWRKEIDRLLPEFEWDVTVRTWYDGEIEPGEEWEPEIDRNLASADIILLFIGQAFVDSRYCREFELPAALKRHARGEARIVPIIIEDTLPDWRTLEFAHLQVLPHNGVPISSWNDRRRALEGVVQGLVDLVVRQGLRHDTRMRWELNLEGQAGDFSRADRLKATNELRHATGDETLRCVSVGPGSIVLTIESTQDAFAHAMRAFESEQLQVVARRQIRKIVKLFGAGVRASSSLIEVCRHDAPPNPDRMLLPSRKFVPAFPKGLALNDENPLDFSFIMDSGHSELYGEDFKVELQKVVDYFKTMLAVPEEDVYVNLAPNESAKLLSQALRGTRLGIALLEFDYRLKRLSASLLHPDVDTGRRFWEEVLDRCKGDLDLKEIPYAGFQRVWIVPDKAVVYEDTRESIERLLSREQGTRGGGGEEEPCAIVIEQRLKAMTEREYLAGRGHTERADRLAAIWDEAFRRVALPVIEAEVNEGENFAEMRQIYYTMILEVWFKNKYRSHPMVARYVDSGNPSQLVGVIRDVAPWSFSGGAAVGPESATATRRSEKGLGLPSATRNAIDRIRSSLSYTLPENREYFERYLDVFENGVFYVEREDLVSEPGRKRVRAFLAGGIDLRRLEVALCERTQ